MHDFQGTDPYTPAPLIPGKGVFPTASVADDGDDRDAATAMLAAEAAVHRTNYLGHRMVNGLDGSGPHPGTVQFSGFVVLASGSVDDLDAPVGLTVTLTGAPLSVYEFIIECTVTGTIGAAPGPSFTWSPDGGHTVYGPISLGSATTYALSGTGLTLHFTGGQVFAFGGLITFVANNGAALVLGGPTTWDGNGVPAYFGGPVQCTNTLTCDGAVAVNATLNANGTLIAAGYVQVPGITVLGTLVRIGDTAYATLRQGSGPNADAAIQPWKKDILTVPTLTADRAWSFDAPPSSNCIEFVVDKPSDADGHVVQLFYDGSTFITLGSGFNTVTFIWNGTKYRVKSKI